MHLGQLELRRRAHPLRQRRVADDVPEGLSGCEKRNAPLAFVDSKLEKVEALFWQCRWTPEEGGKGGKAGLPLRFELLVDFALRVVAQDPGVDEAA